MKKARLTKVQKFLLKLHGANTLETDGVFNVIIRGCSRFVYRGKNLEKKIIHSV